MRNARKREGEKENVRREMREKTNVREGEESRKLRECEK